MKAGDSIEVEVAGVGVLSNLVKAGMKAIPSRRRMSILTRRSSSREKGRAA
jgi:hypothetical protein